jgi:hypothetical protein
MYDDRLTDTDPASPPEERPDESTAASDLQRRFTTCRWHKPAEGPMPSHCTHREVLPMAGVNGFNPESWCPDCAYYKLRRIPRKTPYSGGGSLS